MNGLMALSPDNDQHSQTRIRISSMPVSFSQPNLEGASLSATSELLMQIDALGEEATGALVFDDESSRGAVLVEKGRICWGMAEGLSRRLTDLLRQHGTPPLDPKRLEAIFKECRATGKPFGEALVEHNMITPGGLRSTLRQHTAEAISTLAEKRSSAHFKPHRNSTYDPQFSFSTAEILAAIGGGRAPRLAIDARTKLRGIVQDIATGAVFMREGGSAVLVGIQEKQHFTIEEVNQVRTWVVGQLDVSKALSPELQTIAGSDRHGRAIVAWQDGPLIFIAICADSKALARVLMGASRR